MNYEAERGEAMKITIKNKIIFSSFLMILLIIVASGKINYSKASKIMHDSYEDRSMMIIDSVDYIFNNFMYDLESEILRLEISNVLKVPTNEKEADELIHELHEITSSNKKIQSMYFGTVDGKMYVVPQRNLPVSYDPRNREWYKEALKDKLTVWTSVYKDQPTEKNIVTIAKPIFNDGSLIGVVGVDLNMDTITEYLSQIKIGNTGFFIMTDKNNNIMVHPVRDLIGEKLPEDNLRLALSQQEKGAIGYKYNNTDTLAVFRTLSKSNWKVIGVIQESEVMSFSHQLLWNILISGIVIIVISYIVGILTTNKITKNLNLLVEDIKNIEHGELRIKSKINGGDEFGVIAKHLNDMVSKLNLLLQSTSDAIWEYNLDDNRLFISQRFMEFAGYDLTDGNKNMEFIAHIIHPDERYRIFREFSNFIHGEEQLFRSEFRVRKKDGKYMWLSVRGKAIEKNISGIKNVSGSVVDITEKKEYENRIYNMAYYDYLTNLPNRRYLLDTLNDALKSKSKKEESYLGAVILFDLDDFKKVNDTLGHNFGDKLLIQVADKFNLLQNKDIVVSRFGGDEFVILALRQSNKEDIINISNRIKEIMNSIILIEGKPITITASVGVSIFPDNGLDSDTLIRNADLAMYKAKDLGKNKVKFFDNSMYESFNRSIYVESCIKKAIYEDEFYMEYQPQVDIKTNAIKSFEALIRWNSPELGIVSPAEFIPIAEQSGSIYSLGKFVIRKVFSQVNELREEGYMKKGDQSISINLSPKQLIEESFVDYVRKYVEEFNIETSFIQFEITETVVIENFEKSIYAINNLKNMGFSIILDDFGTGYSSLSYLRKLPVDILKIDKSFIDNLKDSKESKSLIEGIIKLAHEINIQVIAEGVEEEYQIHILKAAGCDLVQGYYYSKPLPIEKIKAQMSKLHR